LGSFHGATDVQAALKDAKQLQLDGVIFHGSTQAVAPAAAWAQAQGLPFAFSFGVDGPGTGASKGKAIGELLASVHDLSFALLDAEGAWDAKSAPCDTDEANALALGQALRAAAPNVIVGDQPWFAIESHGHERPTALALGKGGTFAGFPSDEFASFLQFRAPQLYFRDFHEPNAYQKVRDWCTRDWDTHDTSLKRLQLDRPRTWTLQAYGHQDRPQDFVDALLRARDRLVVLWWDATYRTQWSVTAACLKAVRQIIAQTNIMPNNTAVECVQAWQRSLAMAPGDCDGVCGWKTLSAANLGTKPQS
jgi:hypothetical protein